MRDKGLYVLLIHLPEGRDIKVGALGSRHFRKGFYAYVGSAMGGLHGRVARHLRRQKRKRWHIDYLLQHAHIKEALLIHTSDRGEPRLECALAERLAEELRTIEGFGSSDCRCKGHLFYCLDFESLRQSCLKAVKEIASDHCSNSSLKGKRG